MIKESSDEFAWWKEGIMYQIYPRSFNDTSGNGIGDLNGITEKLDYLQELGVDILWMSPIFSSPNADNGYDISDYKDIMTDFGTMDDFDRLLAGAHQRDMKILLDIVLNHTSDQHPWFIESKSSENNEKRDYYFWRKKPNNWQSIFQGSAWEFDSTSNEYYLHYFLKEQPDLNWENPNVRKELISALRFWLDKGIDGFRLDVIPFISKQKEFIDSPYEDMYDTMSRIYADGPRLHEYLNELYEEVWSQYDCFTVGEGVGISKDKAPLFVGTTRKELHTIYHFDHFNLDQGVGGKTDIKPIDYTGFKDIFIQWDALVDKGCWNIIYLGNHDLGRMTTRFGSQKYSVESAKLLNTLTLTLRGTPIIYMGDELGMTNSTFKDINQIDDVEAKNAYSSLVENGVMDKESFMSAINITGREHARTPYPWNDEENGGFTTSKPWINLNANYTEINAKAQEENKDSVLTHCKRVIELRKRNVALTKGNCHFISTKNEFIFGYIRELEDTKLMVVHHLSDDKSIFQYEEMKILSVLINNYSECEFNDKKIELKPWQSLIFEIK